MSLFLLLVFVGIQIFFLNIHENIFLLLSVFSVFLIQHINQTHKGDFFSHFCVKLELEFFCLMLLEILVLKKIQ